MLQNSRVTTFTVFELLRENQLRGGGVGNKRQPHKMVNHTQTICRHHFMELLLKELSERVRMLHLLKVNGLKKRHKNTHGHNSGNQSFLE